jgi:hypothetical protein
MYRPAWKGGADTVHGAEHANPVGSGSAWCSLKLVRQHRSALAHFSLALAHFSLALARLSLALAQFSLALARLSLAQFSPAQFSLALARLAVWFRTATVHAFQLLQKIKVESGFTYIHTLPLNVRRPTAPPRLHGLTFEILQKSQVESGLTSGRTVRRPTASPQRHCPAQRRRVPMAVALEVEG